MYRALSIIFDPQEVGRGVGVGVSPLSLAPYTTLGSQPHLHDHQIPQYALPKSQSQVSRPDENKAKFGINFKAWILKTLGCSQGQSFMWKLFHTSQFQGFPPLASLFPSSISHCSGKSPDFPHFAQALRKRNSSGLFRSLYR